MPQDIIEREIEENFDQSQNRKYTKWVNGQVTSDKAGFDTYVDQKIRASGGGQGGGASMNYITLETSNTTIGSAIKGEFGVNLLDYRLIGQTPYLGTGSQRITKLEDVHKEGINIYTKGKRYSPSSSIHWAGGSLGYLGVKKGHPLTINTTWIKYPELQPNAHLKLQFEYPKGTSQASIPADEIKIVKGSTGSQEFVPKGFGDYKIDLGSDVDNDPVELSVHTRVWYGNIKPTNLKREFIFKKVNNIELLANHCTKPKQQSDTSGCTLYDEYRYGKIHDTLIKRLNKVKLRDCKFTHVSKIPSLQSLEHYILVEVPEDAKKPMGLDVGQTQAKNIGKELLSNNLGEISNDDIALDDYTKRPYLVKTMIEHENKWYWLIIADKDVLYKFADQLVETEIIYQIDEKEFKINSGGYIVALSNGSKVRSCDYTEIENKTNTDSYVFKDSISGKSLEIHKSKIVSVTPNYS